MDSLPASVQWGPAEEPAYVAMAATDQAGCPLQVTFQNRDVHTGSDFFGLEVDGVVVWFTFEMNYRGNSPDRLEPKPPEGMVSLPEFEIVPENEVATFRICHPMF